MTAGLALALEPQVARSEARRAVRPWRDEARLVVSVVGGASLTLLPAAAFVVGGVSPAVLAFAAAVVGHFLISASAQVWTLRQLRAWRLTARRWPWQLAGVVVVGALVHLAARPLTGSYSQPLGLDSGEGWEAVVGAWTTVLVAAYLVWEREARARHARALQRLLDVQQAQLRMRRRLVDAQLRALQARVDPAFLFATLDAVESCYVVEPARAEALFDELIVFLRAALPHLDGDLSVLAREIDLAESCLRIVALTEGRVLALERDVPPELTRAPFPAGVLLPLVRAALAASRGDGRIALAVSTTEAKGVAPSLVVAIDAPALPAAATLDAVGASLAGLFGVGATLRGHAEGDSAARIVIGLPKEL